MYGPRAAFDAATLAELDRKLDKSLFIANLKLALKDPVIREIIRSLIQNDDKK